MNEKDFQQQVIDYAAICGWTTYHTFDSRRSAGGFPDLVLVRPPELIFAELKSDSGQLRDDQQDWLAQLGETADVVKRLCAIANWPKPVLGVHVWRPADWSDVERILSRRG